VDGYRGPTGNLARLGTMADHGIGAPSLREADTPSSSAAERPGRRRRVVRPTGQRFADRLVVGVDVRYQRAESATSRIVVLLGGGKVAKSTGCQINCEKCSTEAGHPKPRVLIHQMNTADLTGNRSYSILSNSFIGRDRVSSSTALRATWSVVVTGEQLNANAYRQTGKPFRLATPG
jgi:hypothetical protein